MRKRGGEKLRPWENAKRFIARKLMKER